MTVRGRVGAKLVPSDEVAGPYAELVEKFGATVPAERLDDVIDRLPPRSAPAGTTDAFLAESRVDRDGRTR